MIRKSMPSGHDPMGGNRFSEKIMLKQRNEMMIRFMFKTDYEDDIRLFPHSGYVVSYGVLLALLLIAPFVLSSYIVSQLVFVCIYATVGVGLMILTGFTGQVS